ncbi:kynureninase [Emcibacter nanhaiensis]|uniref:Kynureninase n=1 Tax=Emcibacter nanhaiensis TaxID=1505037 RepID=A0A501PK90_9PROT|nr:kynureninase [Emcibacter nanhaiensis]TPD60685.1 kynureninase [Emcibacter nanhaiensis]
MKTLNDFNAHDLDRQDPLARFRDRFEMPQGVIYMNGNSLGPLTRDARERMARTVSEEWGEDLIRGWNTAGWYDLARRVGDKIGRLIGADAGETVMCDSTSVNLFKAVSSALDLRPGRTKIVTEAGNFPTDLYMLDGINRFSAEKYDIQILPRDQIADAIDEETAVVVLTHVHYVTGEIFPLRELTARAHEMGALTVWDLSHSVGAVDVRLNDWGADFAVGCGYKHLNGGPGAPAFLFAARRYHETMRQPLSGWFSHKSPFAFRDDFEPTVGAGRMLCGTTGVLGGSALEAAVDLMLESDQAERLEKMKLLSRYFQLLVGERCQGLGLDCVSPDDVEKRGAHLSYRHENAYAVMQNLIARGVIGDFRAPDQMRFGFSPLFMSFSDIKNAVDILADILGRGSWQAAEYQTRNAVT